MRVTIAVVVFAVAQAICVDVTGALVNEFHYDNDGGDTGEFIEILLEPGESIADFSIVLYNGSNSAPYGSQVASGDFVSGESNSEGFQIFSVAVSPLQNGAPDGFALVNSSGSSDTVETSGGVRQFLSYEGVITATDGIAVGLTSTDVGVSETGSTPIGSSLALTGVGEAYDDFSWSGPSAATMGLFNTSQIATVSTTAVPEPGSAVALLGLAGAAVGRRWHRKRKNRRESRTDGR